MIPVAIGLGSGAEQQAPMGTCIVGGMLTSTVLTLVVIPVVYTLFDDIAQTATRLPSVVIGRKTCLGGTRYTLSLARPKRVVNPLPLGKVNTRP